MQARGKKALTAYRKALATGRTFDKRVKVLLVGQDRVGKTSLRKALRGEPFVKGEPSTDGVQMIPPVKNAGTDAWQNPTSLEHTTVFDHKITAKVTRELFSSPAEQPAVKQSSENRARDESEEQTPEPTRQASKEKSHIATEDGKLFMYCLVS